MALTKRTYTNNTTVITAENLNAIQDEIIRNANNIANKADKNPAYETLNFSDVFTVQGDFQFNESSCKVYRKGNHIFAQLVAKIGTIDVTGGYFTPVQIKSGYRPTVSQMNGGRINNSPTGQTYVNASVIIANSGNVTMYVNENKTYGNNNYAWTTSAGMFIDWEL